MELLTASHNILLSKWSLVNEIQNTDNSDKYHKFLKGGEKEMEPDCSQWCPATEGEAMDTNWHRRFHVSIKKYFFHCESDSAVHKPTRKAVESPPWEMLKTWLDVVLGRLLALPALGHWTRQPSEVPSTPQHSAILWANTNQKGLNRTKPLEMSMTWAGMARWTHKIITLK